MTRKVTVKEGFEALRDGVGKGVKEHWIQGEELPANLNMFATLVLEVGASIGDHPHIGNAEIYQIISGSAEYNDNGTTVLLNHDDVAVCYDGETHGIKNIGDVPLVFLAVIVKS